MFIYLIISQVFYRFEFFGKNTFNIIFYIHEKKLTKLHVLT